MALPPFACAFAIDIGILVHRVLGTRSAIAAGTATAIVAGGTPLGERIDHVLTGARMMLPGVQALLGFQLAAMLADGFDTCRRRRSTSTSAASR
jgi:hypothetical protein